MTDAPAAAKPGPLDHIKAWAEQHILPDLQKALDDIRGLQADVQRTVKFATEHAVNADQLANVVLKFVQAADPAAAPLVAALQAEITRVAAEAKRIAEEYTGLPGAG